MRVAILSALPIVLLAYGMNLPAGLSIAARVGRTGNRAASLSRDALARRIADVARSTALLEATAPMSAP